MRMGSLRGIAAFCVIVACAAVSVTTRAASDVLPASVEREVDFLRDVEPILVARCYECHGRDVVMNGYSMWRRKDAVRGGYSGLPAIESGDSAKSRVIRLVAGLEEGLEMPPTGGEELGTPLRSLHVVVLVRGENAVCQRPEDGRVSVRWRERCLAATSR